MPKVANRIEENSSKDEAWTKKSKRAMTELSALPMVNPYSGRSITVRGDLGESLRQLDSVLSRNKVKLQLRMTERHEKKGYKRRRLESERWRKQFANEVRKKVQLVMKMRDRGA
ncbi:hypothetical protein AGABI2DRAFT_64440 [Agaricus bisporus var. bisporus H97]|nr:hypothetical protein AGABI2DRAFT_64440 [Agaricus bisporus var. bisporus H97]EKV50102.1 hypothetical protein AGABI2DRAFT_64440 [Agaricus bisporus var. bisporus H97]